MRFQFQYQTKAWDYFRLSLYYVYGSMVGMCNIIFTVAMILLTIKMWNTVSTAIRIILLLACMAFPVIQPISLYKKARKQEASQKKNLQMVVDEAGIHVIAEDDRADIAWKSVKRVSSKPGMLVLFSDTTHGYLITDKMLGAQKKEFYQFIGSRITIVK